MRQPPTVSSSLDVVYLARHGETRWNREHRRQGQLDSPLTDRGRAQATAVAETLVNRQIDAVFHSPLGRASETACILAARLELTPVELDDLAEIHHGTMAGLTSEQIEERFPGALEARRSAKYTWRFPGGESYADADARAARALQAVEETGVRRPLLVSHEMIGRVLLMNLLGLDVDAALAEDLPNDLVNVVGLDHRERQQIARRRPG